MAVNLKKISDIEIPNMMFHPYTTGNKILDKCFSSLGGIVPSTTTLLTGVPGSGKSTLACYIASGISKHINTNKCSDRPKGPVIFISREMSDFQLKLIEKQLGNNSDLSNVLILGDKENGNYSNWLQDFIDLEPSLIILDSIQKHSSELDKGSIKGQKEIATYFQLFSKITYCPIILIGHVNKNGSYIGPSSLKHELDAHLNITMNQSTGERTLQMEKNRFGNTYIPYTMEFTDRGIVFEDYIYNISINEEKSIIEKKDLLDESKEFHIKNEKKFSSTSVKKFISILFNDLKDTYNNELLKNEKNIDDIKIVFNPSNKINCDRFKDVIYFGLGKLDYILEDNYSEYDQEINYMAKYINTKTDKLIWTFIHEFCRLFREGKSHTLEFFQKVNSISKDYKFLYSNYE